MYFRDLSVFEVQCYYIISENSELCIIFSNLFLVNVTNLYIQKEHFTLLDKDGKPSMFALVMIATLSTCAQLERDNISFRLTALAWWALANNSGRKQYILKGGKLGRPTGSIKSQDKKREEYKEVINLLNKAMPSVMWQNLLGKV